MRGRPAGRTRATVRQRTRAGDGTVKPVRCGVKWRCREALALRSGAGVGVHAEPRVTAGYNTCVPDYSQTLSKVPIFSGLSESELGFLAQRTVPRQFEPGGLVFGEGEPCTGLYVVERGHIRIFKSSSSGREQVLAI